MLKSLPGLCGTQDVQDVVDAVEAVLKEIPALSMDNLVVMGGSHGGFLCLWLIAKHPSMFRAAVAINPVANIAHMISTTDIPDWCLVECGTLSIFLMLIWLFAS
jgi:acylaminoacyl-peptidase